MRIGIYGGSFDPIHIGHLMIAETAREQLSLDQVIFLPAAQSPLKQGIVPEDAKRRIDMIRLAIGGHPQFVIDDREIRRGGVSYTVDTLREFNTSVPEVSNDESNPTAVEQVSQVQELYFLIGGDSLADFARWKSPEEILQLATLAVVARGGLPPLDWSVLKPYTTNERIEAIKNCEIRMPQIEISSRDIRNRVASGKSIRYLVPPAVAAYITSNGLYKT